LSDEVVEALFLAVESNDCFQLVIDLELQLFGTQDGSLSFAFAIDEFRKYCLLNGLDDIGLTLRHADEIRAFEQRHVAAQPWLANT
ncbi:3-isopropylmalate dehydratase small subunit, partial [Acinetobacter baumannii]